MKTPKTFVTKKDLNQRSEEYLKNKPKLEIEEIKEEVLEELLAGNINSISKRYETIRNVLEKVIDKTYAGLIDWKKDSNKEKYIANATVINAEGKEVILPVLFHVIHYGSLNQAIGFLQLGNENGPCLNTCDKNVKKLAETYFKVEF